MFVLDRFEGDWAVIEFGNRTFHIPRMLLPVGTREGQVLKIEVSIDGQATEARARRIENLAERLFEGEGK